MEIGDVVIAVDCATSSDGQAEHPALVTKVMSPTQINCVVFVDGAPDQLQQRGLKHFSVQPTGNRFRLKGESE